MAVFNHGVHRISGLVVIGLAILPCQHEDLGRSEIMGSGLRTTTLSR